VDAELTVDGTPLEALDIARIHGAMFSGRLTARRLVEACLERVARCDATGPELNAVVTLNAAAVEHADALDDALRRGERAGPLHGIPVVVKDCLETADMPTSFGSEAFVGYVAGRDAAVVGALRRAGAVILAKTTLPDWATSFFSYSSRSGKTKNPYDPSRHAGGSSSGTGAAVASGYAAVGVGTDTGGSIRVPASFCNLVGLRSSPGMVSRSGCSPLVGVQDTVGPMARTVADAVRVFDVLVGFDPDDALTSTYWAARAPASYLGALRPDGLAGLRIGTLREAFGPNDEPAAAAVNGVIDGALLELAAGGATVLDVSMPALGEWLAGSRPVVLLRGRYDIDRFLAERPAAPVKSVVEIVASGRYHPKLDLLRALADGPADPFADPAYHRVNATRADFARAVLTLMATERLNALVYPTCQVVPPTFTDTDAGVWTTLNFPTNTLIASQTALPAMTVPAGLTDDGLPVGLEILVRPYDEPTMFGVAYGFEQVAAHRARPPAVAAAARVDPAGGMG
jgi:Asp-tRNA(Asn)/Glu-tRNA(Gln) amidotransferase A subunit family amidase